ncbi:hypothetical protein VTK56DRAFT_9428 [Thermocarpiscus australiensis]
MGGKVWSKEEEEVFWTRMMPQSPKRLGADIDRYQEKSWYWIANQMTQIMGEKARRKYTHLGVFEHYFQNTVLGRFSPNCGKLPLKYYLEEQTNKRKAHKDHKDHKTDSPAKPTGIRKRVPQVRPKLCQSTIPMSSAGRRSPSALAALSTFPRPPPRSPMPSAHCLERFDANHARTEDTETEEDGLFVTQTSGPWIG